MKFIICVLILLCCLQIGYSQTCATGASYGENSPNSKSNAFDSNTNTGYLLLGNTNGYEIDCCGVVTDWKIFTDAAGTVNLQIWRPSGTSYELVGENIETVGTGDLNVPITSGEQIAVRDGDRIGWWASTNIIKHKAVGGPDNTIWNPMAQPSVGAVLTWTGAGVSSNTADTYAIGLLVDGGNPPVFSSPADGATYTIKNYDPVGLLVETITWTDVDAGDTLTATLDTASSKFSFDDVSGQVTVSSSLSGPTTTETLDFTVEDFCGNTDTLSIDITIENDPPVLHDLPVSYFLSEDSTAQALLYTINATDTADTVSCRFDASVSAAYPFTVQLIPGSSKYGIYVDSNPGFDYDTLANYPLTVVCNDGSENSNTGTFYVYLVENQTPVIHNLQGATILSTTAVIGTTVFAVNATDNEGDAINFTMTCDPTPCPFDIFNSGQIQLNADISSYTTTGYDISIVVSDPKNTAVAKILTVIIQDINDPVLITNLPLTSSYSVPENTPLSSSVFTVSISDQDAQTWTYSMSSTPGTGLSYFSLDSSGLISTSGSLLDYETLSAAGTTSFTFSITVNDGTASDTVPLVIDVINVNEAPSFSQASYRISHDEGPAGTVIGTPSFGVTDPDSGDSYTYSMDCGNDTPYFLMNPSTGQVSFQSDYDTDAGLPTTATCTVTVIDTGSLNDTALLYIDITDVNDNIPVFSPASYSFFISYYASVGTAVGTVTATDGDTGSFGTLTMTLDQTSLLDEYFAIDNNGQIKVKKTPNGNAIGYGTSVTISAIATDGGGQSDTASVTIVISDTTTTSTTTTTDRYKTFIEDNRNVAWLVACLVLLAITCAYLTWLICTCTGVNGCRKFRRNFWQKKKKTWRPRERFKSPKTPAPPPRQSPGFVIVRQPPPPKWEQAWRSSAV